ncbi:hypothetical protein QFZ43_000672 [Streptomyces afghaniensis]|nr:hypothetical protein [Streptomyces afghaniensis]
MPTASGPQARPGPPRPGSGPARLHREPHPGPPRPEPAGLPGPAHRSADPPLRARPARRTDPRGRQEAGPDPPRRRPQGPGPAGRPGHPQQRGLRLRPLRRRRPLPPGLQRDPSGREGRHLRRLPPPCRDLLRCDGHRPHRARPARQRLALPQELRLAAGPGRPRRDRQADPRLPAADHWQGRTLQPHPARRVGLPAALHHQPRTDGGPGRLSAHLQPPPLPHRTRRPATDQPCKQCCGSIPYTEGEVGRVAGSARGCRPGPVS